MIVSKQGLSALNPQRMTGLGSYQTAWTMLYKFRTVMSSCGRSQPFERIEMDETYVGGLKKPGVTGRGAAGKTVVAGAIERVGRGSGRARLESIANAASASLAAFLRSHPGPASTIVTDAWLAYRAAFRTVGLAHEVRNISASGLPVHVALPSMHRLFSLVKRVLNGTYQGSAQPEDLNKLTWTNPVPLQPSQVEEAGGMLFFRILEASLAGFPAQGKDIAVIHRQPNTVSSPRSAPR